MNKKTPWRNAGFLRMRSEAGLLLTGARELQTVNRLPAKRYAPCDSGRENHAYDPDGEDPTTYCHCFVPPFSKNGIYVGCIIILSFNSVKVS